MPAGRFAVCRLGARQTCPSEWVSGRKSEWSEPHLFLLSAPPPPSSPQSSCRALKRTVGTPNGSLVSPVTLVYQESFPLSPGCIPSLPSDLGFECSFLGETSTGITGKLDPSYHFLSWYLAFFPPSTYAVECHSFTYVLIVCLSHQTISSIRTQITSIYSPLVTQSPLGMQ